MEKVRVKYKITVYSNIKKKEISDNFENEYESKILFPQMIEDILKKHNISFFYVYVESLKMNTWGKLFDDEILNLMEGDNFHYKWLNYEIGDIQNLFNLFNYDLNIIVNGPGIGGSVGKKEGITFIINSNEKDRHEFEPHVHCLYSGEEMRVRIDTLEIMKNDKGFRNKKKTKLAIEMIKKNRIQLLEYYNRFAINGESNIKFEMVL